MKERTSRIQPFRAEDGDYNRLVEFAYKVLPLVDSSYSIELEVQAPVRTSEPYEYHITTIQYGTIRLGFLVSHRVGYEPKYGGYAEDTVRLTANGLPSGSKFEIECTRYYHNPRFIEVRLYLEEAIGNDQRKTA